ncbi:hypothetical protein HH219_08620 [Pseudoalteromonas sp. NEC-BIFX-2020_015]|uniref:hypothetical protein n=1 Tax=Pseudoalteromonas sp. NEC-BIFX-2020_015 TaxID=2729544 RepID=UPI0014615DB5|nr:hypothetical protein [Pseudoalteromonas sp. NEC-BIFX-2020_015]NMR25586.1 hypothetical protein [Pseudoalteromonas sp. NEC-BIFX-2020_015]
MDTVNPQSLVTLFEKTHQVLRCYNNKSQWPNIYPLLSQLAERYYQVYEHTPHAMQAQLTLYVKSYGYTTNLVVNQCVLITAFCKSLGYDSKVTQQLIFVCLTNYLCVQTQSNKLALRQPLNLQEKKQWQCRHQLAIKLLQSSQVPTDNISAVLARLNKYKQALLSTPQIMIYDGATILVALANIIAMNITYREHNDHISVYKAVADIYLRTPNQFAQYALKSIIAHIGPFIPGSVVKHGEQDLVYIGEDKTQKHLVISIDTEQKIRWHSIKAQLDANAKQRPIIDKRVLFSVWFSEHLVKNEEVNEQQQALLILISQVKVQHEYSYTALIKLLQNQTQTIENLCQSVKPYNKENLPGKDLRHSLCMVGLDNAPAIIQHVLFEQLVTSHKHPLQRHIHCRLRGIINILALFFRHNSEQQFEQLALPVYAYICYLIEHASTDLSRKTLHSKEPNNDKSPLLSWLFGVRQLDPDSLSQYLLTVLSDNPWTQALLDAEQHKKKSLSDSAKLWVAVKLISTQVYQPKYVLSPWQKQILDSVLKELGWPSTANFYSQLTSLGLSNSV